MARNLRLHQDREDLNVELNLKTNVLRLQKAVFEVFINDILPHSGLMDPLEQLENINDVDHE
ncbi:hypothetical protein L914_12038 [Phytophthora nicotianae]|uniref:Uncharacterized protein n=1 Tax=Phytophthora nicotianae TaxID=4792 RepID=W2N161_PHYNI|nr:hypothetical protein L914_12038 [Phytophthora nicotianae]